MKVLLLEDEAPAARRLQKLLMEVDSAIQVLSILESVKAAVHWFAAHPPPDLVFMDVQLADGLCFEIFRQVTVESPVIFTTAYDQYALQAFKVNSIDYLLKPVTKTDLTGALEKHWRLQKNHNPLQATDAETIIKSLLHQQPSYRTRFLIEHRDLILKLETKDIAYFYSESRLSHAVTHERKILVIEFTMEELDKQLDPQLFLRISRQIIVSAQAVTHIYKYFSGKLKITLYPDVIKEVIVSREKSSRFKEWLGTSK